MFRGSSPLALGPLELQHPRADVPGAWPVAKPRVDVRFRDRCVQSKPLETQCFNVAEHLPPVSEPVIT